MSAALRPVGVEPAASPPFIQSTDVRTLVEGVARWCAQAPHRPPTVAGLWGHTAPTTPAVWLVGHILPGSGEWDSGRPQPGAASAGDARSSRWSPLPSGGTACDLDALNGGGMSQFRLGLGTLADSRRCAPVGSLVVCSSSAGPPEWELQCYVLGTPGKIVCPSSNQCFNSVEA